MFKCNCNKLFPFPLLAGLLIAGLTMTQGATATVGPGHEKGDEIVHSTGIKEVQREGPRGSVVAEHEGDDRTRIGPERGGRTGPLPVPANEAS